MDYLETLKQLVPESPSDRIVWEEITRSLVPACFYDLKTTEQDPVYHGEGDVLTHTRMVIRSLIGLDAFHALEKNKKAEVFLAAILHDIGKVKTTRLEEGKIISPNHARVSSQIIREFLWKTCGLCGTPDLIAFRETVCALTRYHALPVLLPEHQDKERKLLEMAAMGELLPDFTWDFLCLLSEADVTCRTASDIDECLSQIGLTRRMAADAGCLNGPYQFADGFTKRAFLSGRNESFRQKILDDTWGEVILLSGLPGTGKDTWIKEHQPGVPVVSPDESWAESTKNREQSIRQALEKARVFLENKQPFVWNAANLTSETRQDLVRFFEDNGAGVRIVYLETDWKNLMQRSSEHPGAISENSLEKLLSETVLPMPYEARIVEWLCV